MNKYLKKGLIILSSILGVILIAAFIGFIYIYFNVINFEKSQKMAEITEVTKDGFTFRDYNGNGTLDKYEDNRLSIEVRANDLLSQMTTEEKIHLLKGSGMKSGIGWDKDGIQGAVGTIVSTPRLGIPTVYLSDGPAGLRINPIRKNDDKTYYCTAFPIGTLLASTWNTELVGQVGNAMGNEAKEYGIDVILGPGANINRNPLCGRNFEYYSEDPVLSGNIGASMVNGIESNGVGTSVKHFVANNQETNRNFNDVIISERAMREIYLKGFEIIVNKSQPWTIMSSYNKVNGEYTSESRKLLTDVLRNDWDFKGIVMSDWFGGNDAVGQLNAGNDLLEPGTNKQWKALKKGAKNGTLLMENIDTSVKRILELVLNSQKMQNTAINNNPDLKLHAQITRQSAAEGMVLLKNEGILPFQNIKNVALLGVTSYEFIAGGTGSGYVNAAYTVSMEEGMQNAGFEINEVIKNAFDAHKLTNKKAFVKPQGFKAMMVPFNPPQLILSKEKIQESAKTADIAIITIGRNSGEGGDRKEIDDFLLTEQEQEMIQNTCDVFHAEGKKVVVVLNIGGVIETSSWKAKPDAIVLAWQGGQEGGNTVADILSGKVNPSGKLPVTFPVNLADHASSSNYPMEGIPMNIMNMLLKSKEKPKDQQVKNIDYTLYDEGIYVGYRHFDKSNSEVAYPFGFGLSYTNFEYSNMNTSVINDTLNIQVTIKNTGDKAGKEVLQVYSSMPSSKIDRAIQELKAFSKTPSIAPMESVEISLSIPIAELSYWNETDSNWMLEKGSYTIRLGSSSRDIRLTQVINL